MCMLLPCAPHQGLKHLYSIIRHVNVTYKADVPICDMSLAMCKVFQHISATGTLKYTRD